MRLLLAQGRPAVVRFQRAMAHAARMERGRATRAPHFRWARDTSHERVRLCADGMLIAAAHLCAERHADEHNRATLVLLPRLKDLQQGAVRD